jgi:hypothetical protein
MTHISNMHRRAAVPFPEFKGERVYMRPITNEIVPADLSRWQATVDAMTTGIPTPEIMYLMVDQKSVKAGEIHRRPGMHVDGYWVGNGHNKHRVRPVTGHGPLPGVPGWGAWPETHSPGPSHIPSRGEWDVPKTWNTADFAEPETLLLASNAFGCRAFIGKCHGGIGDMGDCSGMDLSGFEIMPMDPGYCYAGSVGALHESVPTPVDSFRTVVRLNVPGVRV